MWQRQRFWSDGLVCLQNIRVTDSSGELFYKAALQWLVRKSNQFKLLALLFEEFNTDNPVSQ